MPDHDDELRRALMRLNALRNNIPSDRSSLEAATYIADYHHVLDRIAQLGYDVSDFRVPAAWVKSQALVTTYGGEAKTMMPPAVETTLFCSKLDAVLGYFELDEAKTPIGFNPPDQG
jgi:hypothetical protein